MPLLAAPTPETQLENPAPRLHAGAPERRLSTIEFNYPGLGFEIAVCDGIEYPQSASSMLVERQYALLGYAPDGESGHCADPACEAMLQARTESQLLGTLSVRLDSTRGLQADALYPLEVARLRQRGRVCEFTRLALATRGGGREILCSLFYAAYAYAHLAHSASELLIEVNPGHAAFYCRMLGFQRIGSERICARVNAPAVLLHLDLNQTRLQIAQARAGHENTTGTLYKFALPLAAELDFVRDMTSLDAIPPRRQ